MKKYLKVGLGFLFLLCFSAAAWAQVVSALRVEGNNEVVSEHILRAVKTKVGDELNQQTVMDDIQAERTEEVVFPDELMEIGIIAENNQTGEVIAIGGGRNYGRGGSMLLNHATDQYKQPGSSVKPFLDYALAFEYLGWATSHVVTDRPITYQGTNMIIKNANGTYNGQVTLSYAISASLNTPAIQALQDVLNTAGWDTVVQYVNSLGFSQVNYDNFDIGFAIGGSNFTASAREVMAAHAILMNGGNYIKPHTIQKIEFRSGTSEPLVPNYEPSNVLSPQAAYLAPLSNFCSHKTS